MRITLFVLCLLLGANLNAQKIEILKKAHNLYKAKEYVQAQVEYEKLWTSASGAKILGVSGKINLADCYRRTDQPFKAKSLYVEVLPYFDDDADNYLHYGEVLMQLGLHNDAIGQFEKHSKILPEDGRAAEYIRRIQAIRDIKPLFDNVTITPQDIINDSSSRQTGITYYGDAVVYTSDQEEEDAIGAKGYFNMRISGLDSDGNLKKSEKFSVSLNDNNRHDGPATFSRDGRVIYYSQSATDPEGKAVVQIWISTFREGVWSEAEPLPIMFQGKDFTHPSLSGDGQQLYFASNMKGTLGGLDIWVAYFEDGRWTYPKNLGKDINTPKDDAWPYIHPDGDLYFSSKGHSGFGGYDVFRTRPLGNGVDWLDVQNMGSPFNTSFSDVSFVMSDDQVQGFLSSNRSKSYNIFKFVIDGAEPQSIPDDLPPRKSTGKSELVVNTDLTPLTSNLPEQRPDESDENYIDRVQKFVEANLSNLTEEPPNNDNLNQTSNSNNNTSSSHSKSGDVNPTSNPFDENPITPTVSEKIELIIKLQLIDGFDNGLANATVTVKNKFTNEEIPYQTDANGLVEIHLAPNQKYVLIASKEGYTENSLPVGTMGATSTETVGTSLQIQKLN